MNGTAKLMRCWLPVRHPLLLSAGLLGFSLIAGCHPATNITEARLTETGELVALSGGGGGAPAACFTCHGLEGQGDGDAVPRLAGLDEGYLFKQMQDYASGMRPDDVMGRIAGRLTDDQRRAVAAHYAGMPVQARPSSTQGVPTLWSQGDPARGVTACAVCHGPSGLGGGPGNPAVAGQPAAYTLEQLRRWKKTDRRNDPRGVMTAAVAPLSDAEMAEIAAWLAGQSPAPSPDSGGPTASVSASAAAAPAASRGTRRPDR